MSTRQLPLPALSRLDVEFDTFHREHPHYYAALVRLAREAKDAGRTRIGAKALWERLRWELWLAHGTTPKCNNNLVSRYARLIAANEPDLAPLFEFRELRS